MPRYILTLLLLSGIIASAQDRSAWQNLAQLQPGNRVRLSLKSSRSVTDEFRSWTPEEIKVGSTTAKREDVAKLERFRKTGWSRGKTAAVGALIGGGAGAGFGAAAAGCPTGTFGPCITRAGGAIIVGAAGALVGALVGALIPHKRSDVIYIAR